MNNSFSTQLPGLQLVIDHTSMKTFMTCPQYYKYRIVDGWQTRDTSPHLSFGQYFHEGREIYEKAKANNADHEQALIVAIRHVLTITWDHVTNHAWHSGHGEKNRNTLLRSLIWYLDDYGKNDTLETLILASGKPAVEQSFKFGPKNQKTGQELTAITGEQILVAGHFDRIALQQGYPYVCDVKTTSYYQLDDKFWAQFTPDNQVSLYTYAGQAGLMTPIRGVIIDGVRVKVTFTEFSRREIMRDPNQLEEWYRGFEYNVSLMGQMAERNFWPMNDSACTQYGGCPFLSVCSKTPGARRQQLETFYTKEIWDPTIPRE